MTDCKECNKRMRKDTITRHKCKGRTTEPKEALPRRKKDETPQLETPQSETPWSEIETILGMRFTSPAPYPHGIRRIKRRDRQKRDSEEEERAKRRFKQLEPDSDWNSSKEDTENYTAKRESDQKIPQKIPQVRKRHEKKEKYQCYEEG